MVASERKTRILFNSNAAESAQICLEAHGAVSTLDFCENESQRSDQQMNGGCQREGEIASHSERRRIASVLPGAMWPHQETKLLLTWVSAR